MIDKTNKFNPIKENVLLITSQFKNLSKAIFLGGSFATGSSHTESDLDFEVVVKNLADLKTVVWLPKLKVFFTEVNKCLKVIDNSQGIDIIQVKQEVNGVITGIRFINQAAFTKIANLDLHKLNKDICLLSLRAKHKKDQALYYRQRNFFGERIKIKKRYWLIGGFQFTLVPAVAFNQKGSFYPGSLLDRYLACPKILVDHQKFAEERFKKLSISLSKRYFEELRQKKGTGESGVLHCLSRWDCFSKEIKDKLVKQEKKIYTITQPKLC